MILIYKTPTVLLCKGAPQRGEDLKTKSWLNQIPLPSASPFTKGDKKISTPASKDNAFSPFS